MTFPLRFRTVLLLAASTATGPALAQAPMPGPMPAAMAGDPFAGSGAYAVPISGPVAVAYGDPATLAPGTVISSPQASGQILSGPTPSGGPVYMAPQMIGGMTAAPGSPGCNCGPGGAPMMQGGAPMMMSDPSMGGMISGPTYAAPSYETPSYGVPMGGMPYGAPAAYDDGCCLNDCCLLGGCGLFNGCCDPCGAPAYDPCQPACPPTYDACQPACPPVCDPCQPYGGGYPGAGVHGAGGASRCGWSTGYSFVFLKPHFGSNDALTVTRFNGGNFTTTNRDFDYSLDIGSRVFVEWVSPSDTGFRATWFGFDTGSDDIAYAVPGGTIVATPVGQSAITGDTVRASSGLDLDTIDLEVTQRIAVRRSQVRIGGGLRWADYDQSYRSSVTGITASTAEASRRFDGFGPTIFAELRKPIGGSGFSVLGNIRGSMLYGSAESASQVNNPGAFSATTFSDSDDFVAIGESQLGLEWSTWLGRRTVFFVQAALETQYWLGVGTAFDHNDDLGLYGFNTTLGLEW